MAAAPDQEKVALIPKNESQVSYSTASTDGGNRGNGGNGGDGARERDNQTQTDDARFCWRWCCCGGNKVVNDLDDLRTKTHPHKAHEIWGRIEKRYGLAEEGEIEKYKEKEEEAYEALSSHFSENENGFDAKSKALMNKLRESMRRAVEHSRETYISKEKAKLEHLQDQEDRLLRNYELYRNLIKEENQLIKDRLASLLTIQGLLFTALGFTLKPNVNTLPNILFVRMLGSVGILVSVVTWISLVDAGSALRKLTERWTQALRIHEQGGVYAFVGPDVRGLRTPEGAISCLGVSCLEPLVRPFPAIFTAVWAAIIYYADQLGSVSEK